MNQEQRRERRQHTERKNKARVRMAEIAAALNGTDLDHDDMQVLLQEYRTLKIRLQQLNTEWNHAKKYMSEVSIGQPDTNPYRR
jgi:hypothetical protein